MPGVPGARAEGGGGRIFKRSAKPEGRSWPAVCEGPVTYAFEGEMFVRSCGSCARCRARKKRDVSGRAAAEAYGAAEVVVTTLTYAEGHAGARDFVTRDRQLWMAERVRRQNEAIGRFALDSPNIAPDWLPPVQQLTGLRRQLAIRGEALVPGAVVRDGPGSEAWVRGALPRLRKPVSDRRP